MNVTEKQKEILLSFMQRYPDFGRGRLRYNSENKRKIDELWEKLSVMLNAAGCGPCKSSKEWAKDSISMQSCMKQKKQPVKDIQTNTKKEKYFTSSFTNLQDINIMENEENVFEQNKAATSIGNVRKCLTAKNLQDVKKPRLMATAIDLFEKKSFKSDNIKQKMLELKEKNFELRKEKLTVHKEILQELKDMNNQLSLFREEVVGQYLQE